MKKSRTLLQRAVATACTAAILGTSCSLTAFAYGVGDPDEPAQAGDYPYYDTSLSYEERAVDLVSRMTLEEKITQLEGRNIPGIPRLGVRSTHWYREALHGVARLGPATSFPTGLGIASTWDPELVEDMAHDISDEARVIANDVQNDGRREGLNFWSPTINLARDPRWGRSEESYGEDPFLTTQIASGFVNGMQGANEDGGDTHLKAMSTIKHLVANNKEDNRETSSSNTDERTLREYYAKTFQDVIGQTAVQSVMTTYNAYNNVPTSLDTNLIDTMLRRTWGFRGHVVTDCGALAAAMKQGWKPDDWDEETQGAFDGPDVAAYALKNGIDLNCGDVYVKYTKQALEEGLITMDDIDNALVRTFTARMKTGEFDPNGSTPWDDYTKYKTEDSVASGDWQLCDEKHDADECPLDHTRQAEDMATQSVVLLKNEKATAEDTEKILPLDPAENNNVVVVGALADEVILGDYSTNSPRHTSTPLEGITKYLQEGNPNATVTYIEGGASTERVDWLRNMSEFTFYRTDGTSDTYKAADADATEGCVIENGGANIGSMKPSTAWVKFENINVNDLKSVGVKLSSGNNCGRTLVEVRRDSVDGTLLASFEAGTTSGWNDFQEFTADCTNYGNYDQKDVYLVFKEIKGVDLSEKDQQTIREADTVIAYVGTTTNDAGEGRDRKNLEFPREESAMIQQLAELNPRTVVYIQAVGQMDIEAFKDEVPAIFWCTYNGQAQGNAAGRLLFGDANPSAKLVFTWYSDIDQLSDMDDYSLQRSEDSNGRTYQYFDGDITYPFGYGLSYSSFQYSNLKISSDAITPNDKLTVEFDVTNTSEVDGKETAQVYIVSPNADGTDRPVMRLKGFDKQEIPAGKTVHYSIEVDASDFYYWDEVQEKEVFDLGEYTVLVGPDSGNTPLEAKFTLSGERTVELQSVTSIPTGRVIDSLDKTITAKTSGVHNDQTFVNLEDSSAKVTYTSSNPGVAAVDENGVVTGVADGLATITASITENGVTKIDSFAVKVELPREPEPTNLKSFDFTMGNAAEQLKEIWQVTRENTENWAIDENGLTITTEKGDLWRDRNDAKNMFWQDANGDWTVETAISFDEVPTESFQQGGIAVYQDDDNFFKFVYQGGNGKSTLTIGAEIDGSDAPISSYDKAYSGKQIWFRMEKLGDTYTASYSENGTDFVEAATYTATYDAPKVVLLANSGTMEATPRQVSFSYFKVIGEETINVDSVALDQETLTMKEGETAQLNATVSPENATNKNVTWTTSDDKVAAVDANGTVTAVAEGEAVITVTTEDGGYTAACTVTVQKQDQPVCTADAAIRVASQRDENGNAVFHVTLRDAKNIAAVQVNYNAADVVDITGENGFTYVPAGSEDGIMVLCYGLEGESKGQTFNGEEETVIATITVSGEKPMVQLDEVLIAAYEGEDGQPVYGEPVDLIQDTATFRGCDINEDGKVDLLDVVAAMKFYQVKKTDGEIWESAQVADINGDEKVDLEDLIGIVVNFAG